MSYPRTRYVPAPTSGIVWACFNCKRIVAHEFATCRCCGYKHGHGVSEHPAVAIT